VDRSIIISSGRCGSTLLSDLIAEEPQTLSANEFFLLLPRPDVIGPSVMSGTDYWHLMSSTWDAGRPLIRLGIQPEEIAYPENGRWHSDPQHLPLILSVLLPKITADPDALFDRLAQRMPSFPRQTVTAHHRLLLDVLAEMFTKSRWVERSGGSSFFAPYLLQSYPEARIVYLTRDWRQTAISMSKHPVFRLWQLRLEAFDRFGFDPTDTHLGQHVPPEAEKYLPDRLTADLLPERGQHLDRYLRLCAYMHGQAQQAIAEHSPEHLLQMTYEDLRADPTGQLTALGEFLGFADSAGWAAQVAHRVRPTERPAVTGTRD
jgi:putative sulfotransferase